MNRLRIETYSWLAAPLGGENPQAVFRDAAVDMPVAAKPGLAAEVAATIGKGCGRRILPYRLQDRYGRERQPRDFKAVVLENENLKATFLPELGGRLMSLIHKPTSRELLFNNPVFQPANLALRDAWFAGGIEWNIGQFGHSFHTCAPVFAAAIPGLGGSKALRLYDYERCKGLLWQIDFHLPPGAEFLYAFTRVVNPNAAEVAMYWWTNTAVVETPDVRVLAPAAKSVYVDYGASGTALTYGQAELPGLPTVGGADGTYSKNLSFTNEFFFQCQQAELPWEAALDGHGTGFIEASTHPLNVRKLFCWGMHQGGKHWKEFLSESGKGDYIEIQAGLAPTQQHTVPMPGNSEWCWMQAFGMMQADPAKVHGTNWTAAWQTVDAKLKQRLTAASLQKIQEQCRPFAESAPLEILHAGSGWGALENRRLAACAPRERESGERMHLSPHSKAFAFPESTLGPEQAKWLTLLETGALPEQDPSAAPGEYMIQPEWRALLEKSLGVKAAGTPGLVRAADCAGPEAQPPWSVGGFDTALLSGGFDAQTSHWFSLLHLGVMRMEAFDEAGAKAAWEESLRLRPSPWAHRNLAVLALRSSQTAAALAHYHAAWELASVAGTPDVSFALEYLAALLAAGEHEAAWNFHQALPPEMQALGTVRLLAAKAAFARNDLAFVEAALDADYASIREGARDLTDLWFALQAKKIAARTGQSPDDALRDARKNHPPPFRIDFRVVE